MKFNNNCRDIIFIKLFNVPLLQEKNENLGPKCVENGKYFITLLMI